MSKLARARIQVRPWAGFLLGGLGLVLHHQLGNYSNFDHCATAGASLILPSGVVALLLAGAGAMLSWRLWRRGEHHETGTRRFIALVSVMAAGVFAFAILLTMAAALTIPRCFG